MVQRHSYWNAMTRRKRLIADGTEGESKLNRVLGLWDLTALGVGSTLGAGVYVLAGKIARDQAGPSVMLSFAIAALASLLAGICYAEFGARVPKAGSAYVYSYVCIGEFVAFVIGWNLILEYVIGTASVCRGISLYMDTLLNNTLKETFAEVAPMHVSFLGSYFDFLAFGLVMVFGVLLSFGVETSTMANNLVTCLNIFILLFVIVAGAIKADFSNWSIDPVTVNATNIGTGGYFPYGIAGTFKGAATCFFGFVGFDCIATTGEEVQNPRKNIPRSILLSLFIIFLCYFGISTVLTLMLPYYLQDANAPLPYAFESVGWPVAMWIVTIGGLIGLLASLFGAFFPLPRVMYSMAQDGLLFRFLGKISPRFHVPVTGSIVAAIFTALIAGLFDLAQLVNLLSIGTLLAYSVVAISITILRYMEYSAEEPAPVVHSATETTSLTSNMERFTCSSVCTQLFNVHRVPEPNMISTRIVGVLTSIFCLLCLGLGLLFMHAFSAISSAQPWALAVLIVLLLCMSLNMLLICLQPREAYSRLFRVPFVPIVPGISIFINIYLMLQLDSMTWIRFGVWMLLGLPIFFACWCLYDIKNPQQRNPERVEFIKTLKGEPLLPLDKSKAALSNDSVATHETQLKSSLCTLDQIQNLSEVGDDLIEVKHANGKVFYVEDTRSENSTVTMNSNEAQYRNDEQYVMAMLDDMLEAEDTQQKQLEQQQIFGRHFSLDSEMYPSVIETTIVATVHSSSSDDEVASQKSLQHTYEACKQAASQMLEEMFESATFHEQLEAAKQQLSTVLAEPKLRRASSVVSLASQNSSSTIDDPIHSEKFKNHLSHIILNANVHKVAAAKKQDKTNLLEASTRPSLKQSKSETDVRLLMLKAISELKTADDKAAVAVTEPQLNNSTIPRAPKFDPVLYNTINSISWRKQRPSLSQQLVVASSTPVLPVPVPQAMTMAAAETTLAEATNEPVQFKAKLEAILKRGPSHRTQQRPDVLVRSQRPQSMYIKELND